MQLDVSVIKKCLTEKKEFQANANLHHNEITFSEYQNCLLLLKLEKISDYLKIPTE